MSSPFYRYKKYHPTKEEFNENLILFDVCLNQVFSSQAFGLLSHIECTYVVVNCEHWTFCNFQMKHGIIGLYPKCVFPLCCWKKNKKNNNKSLNERPWHQHVYHKTFHIMVVGYTALGIRHWVWMRIVHTSCIFIVFDDTISHLKKKPMKKRRHLRNNRMYFIAATILSISLCVSSLSLFPLSSQSQILSVVSKEYSHKSWNGPMAMNANELWLSVEPLKRQMFMHSVLKTIENSHQNARTNFFSWLYKDFCQLGFDRQWKFKIRKFVESFWLKR